MDLYLWGTSWALVCILVGCHGQTEEDEKRPYKFAFAIEGYQHRSEEKDERGIIMGEFGFVTGDGVYHVTVYATDENGNFKILKMKNFYIGLPGEGTTAAPTKAPAPTPPPTRPPSVPSTTKSAVIKHLEGLMGCSGCIVPDKKNGNTGDKSPSKGVYGEGLLDERFGGGSPGAPGRPGSRPPSGVGKGQSVYGKPQGGSGGGGQINYPGAGQPQPGVGQGQLVYNKPQGGARGGQVNYPVAGLLQPGGPSQYGPSGGQNSPGSGQGIRPQTTSIGVGRPSTTLGGGGSGGTSPVKKGKESKTPQYGGSGGASKPGTPNTASGLPPGVTMDDIMALLYKFNYTLRYHGHHETGYRSGNKEGGYFFNGRDGLGRSVKYLANEFGFQPNITLVDLGLQSPDTPQGENEENELRGNEFKWFYSR